MIFANKIAFSLTRKKCAKSPYTYANACYISICIGFFYLHKITGDERSLYEMYKKQEKWLVYLTFGVAIIMFLSMIGRIFGS